MFLDELGHEPNEPTLWEIIDTRYREGRITITTSGMRRAQLEQRYGSAFVRRLILGRMS